MTLPFKDYAIGAGVVAVLAGGVLAVREIQHRAVEAMLLKQQHVVSVAAQKAVDSAATLALQRVKQSEADEMQALALAAAQKRQQVHSDSIARSESDERARAERMVADSGATRDSLRAELGRLAARSAADSVAASHERQAGARLVSALMVTLSADSAALAAERQHSAALAALNASMAKELGLVKQSQPSTFGTILRTVAWSGGAFALGRITK